MIADSSPQPPVSFAEVVARLKRPCSAYPISFASATTNQYLQCPTFQSLPLQSNRLMVITLRRLDFHCTSQAALACPLKLLLLYLTPNPTYMLWGAVYDAGACIPSVCLKYFVICLANALLATGWLLLSILSIAGELLPRVFGVPPTMPRLPTHPAREALLLSKSKRKVGLHPQADMSTPTDAVRKHRTTVDSGLPQRVPLTTADAKDGVAASSPQPLPRNDPRTSDGPQSSVSFEQRSSPPAISPPESDLQGSLEAVRGRKLSFFRRKRLSASRDRRPLTRRVSSVGEIVESPEQSPERPDHSEACSIKMRLKPSRSVDFAPKTPVPRTDPYQAPYFFPTPLSPDARGYTSRVRSERIASPLTEMKSFVGAPASPVSPRISASPTPSDAHPVSSSSRPENVRHKSPRRSWHIPFKHELQRPTSWTSDSTTAISAGSHPGDSSDVSHPPSPTRSRKSSQKRRSSGGVLSPLSDIDLSPLEELQAARVTPLAVTEKPTRRKSWNFPFRHRRVNSEASSNSSLTQPLSEHGVDELPKPRARPTLHRTR